MSWLAVGSAAVSIGGSLLGGSSKKKAAERARQAKLRALESAEGQYRDPYDIIGQLYPELYGRKTQDIILGAERRLMPQYQELQFQRMGMLTPELLRQQRAFQEAELAGVSELAPMAREAGEDPRLAGLADLSAEEAERLTAEAQEGLSPLDVLMAERRAAQQGISRGRELGASQIARSALERREAEEDVQARRAELARSARMSAAQQAQVAKVDPFTAILGRTPSAYQTSAGLSLGQLGPSLTSPDLALGMGGAEDYRKAQLELSKGGIESAYQTARGNINAGMYSSIGSSLGSLIGGFGGFGGTQTPSVSPVSQSPLAQPLFGSQPGGYGANTQLTGFMGAGF